MSFKGDGNHRQFITHYTPETFLKPLVVFSLITNSKKNTSELAICFVSGLNWHHVLGKLYGQGTKDDKDITKFKVIGNYNTINKGLKAMQDLTLNMDWWKFLDFYKKHYDNSIPGMDKVRK